MGILTQINTGIIATLKELGIKTRPNTSLGYWVLFLFPTSILLSYVKNDQIVSNQYKYATLISFGFIIANVAIIYQCNKHNNFPNVVITTIIALYTSFLFYTCLHKGVFFSIFSGFFTIFSYMKCFPLILKICPKCFSFGEAGLVVEALVLFLYMSTLNITESFGATPTKISQITNVILQVGTTGVGIICLLVYKCRVFRRPIPFYTITLTVIFVWIFFLLHLILKRSPVLWILSLLTDNIATVQMLLFWVICSSIAILYLRLKINQGKKANTVVRKMFHILAVLVILPGLIDQCSVLYLATGVIFAVFVALELLRLINLPPFGSILQDGFTVFADEKDVGGIALTPIYLLVGCSMPFWIHPEPCDVTDSAGFNLLPLISGILAVGIGDTMASACGKLIGRHHWHGSKKTIEGTFACILSQISLIFTLIYLGYIRDTQENVIRSVAAAVISSLVEAKTDQVDNLILPLINYLILV